MTLRRASALLLMLLAAFPALAHGESLLVTCAFIVYGLPAALLLLVPWHKLWARALTVLILAAGAMLMLFVFLDRIDYERLSAGAEWVILLSPTLIALTLALILRRVAAR